MWDFNYVISGWMLVALVVIPFCFGLLYGMHIAHKRFMIKLVKSVGSNKLHSLINGNEEELEEDRENADKGFSTTPVRRMY